MESVPGAVATGEQHTSGDPVATAPGTDLIINSALPQFSRSLERSARKSYALSRFKDNPSLVKGGFQFMPEVGDMAPDFELKSNLEKDKKVKLSDFRGKK